MTLKQLGPYQLERVLGQGGMGTVYAAVNQETGQRAAVKVLSAVLATKGSFRTRFESEIETLKRLRHPQIVQLFGYGEQDNHLFYAMELVEGRSLQQEMRAGRVFTVAEVIQYGIEIAGALKLAHDSGVIHRDLKPANLMLAPDGHIKLTDFGIAKLFGGTQLTADGGIVGTVDYMSPEQAEGKPVTVRSDLYSLGSVLYALLARRPPFTGRSVPQVIHALRYETAVPLRRMAPDVPEELEAIVHQLMEKDPASRVATALIVGNRLKALQHGLASRHAAAGDEPRMREDESHAGLNGLTTDFPASSEALEPLAPSPPDLTWDSALDAAPSGAPPIDRNQPTQVDSMAGGPSSALSHFTSVAEEERSRSRREHEERQARRSSTLTQVGFFALLTIVIVLALWQWWRPPSADRLYATIQAASVDDDGNGLRAVESEIDRFLELYSDDPRHVEVARHKERLRNELEQRRFERRARRADDAESLTTVERLYADAMQSATTQPDTAIARLQSLVDAFGGDDQADESTRKSLELAGHQLERLRALVERQHEEDLSLARRRLDWADQRRTEDAAAARRVYQALVDLYDGKSWAQEIVERARKSLE